MTLTYGHMHKGNCQIGAHNAIASLPFSNIQRRDRLLDTFHKLATRHKDYVMRWPDDEISISVKPNYVETI